MAATTSVAGTTRSSPHSPAGVEGHALDEAHAHAPLPAEGGEVEDLVVVDTPDEHAVDLDRVEAGVDGGVDTRAAPGRGRPGG